MKTLLQTIAFTLCICLTSYAQNVQSNYINYQGAASDASGNKIANTAIAVQIALKFGSPTATANYIENHTPTTDANGVFSIQIGNGTLVSGAYNSSDFGTQASYTTVSLNGTEVGTTELYAVPFALSSGDSQWNIIPGSSTIINKNIGGVNVNGTLSSNSLFTAPRIGTFLGQSANIDEFSKDGTFSDNSDTAVPTEKAVKTYVDTEVQTINSTISNLNTVSSINDLNDGKTGSFSVFLGSEAGFFNTGIRNVAVGYQALNKNTFGRSNTAYGTFSLYNNTTGGSNTAIGLAALFLNETGEGNVALGYSAGNKEKGSNKLYIANSDTNTPLIYGEFDKKIINLNGATTATSSVNANADLILGGTSNTTKGDDGIISSDPKYAGSDIFIVSNDAVVIQLDNDDNETGEFEIKAGDGTEIFEVKESGDVRVNGSLVHSSDRRLKKDIEILPYGLNEVLKLEPKFYNWKNRTQNHKSLGLIAQEVQKVIKEIVVAQDDAQKTLAVSYTELIPVLINAIKEQQTQIETLKATNITKDTVLAEVLKRLNSLENKQQLKTKKEEHLISKN